MFATTECDRLWEEDNIQYTALKIRIRNIILEKLKCSVVMNKMMKYVKLTVFVNYVIKEACTYVHHFYRCCAMVEDVFGRIDKVRYSSVQT